MKLYSTNNKNELVSLKEAVMNALPRDNGLYMPLSIPKLSKEFFKSIEKKSFKDIAYGVCLNLFQEYIPIDRLKSIIDQSITFPAPLVSLDQSTHVLELFHGPTMAFKDFGARFMSQLMAYFNEDEKKKLVILVATSGDTGGAVASGFYNTLGVEVIILYPSGKVSNIQEKQLTTLGANISAVEIEGTFDDCQAMVKKAFLDPDLSSKHRLSSANSINIARLIPQSFYYFEAYKQLKDKDSKFVFSVPSGNFGNLTAGVFAKLMGLPVHGFIAATNLNDVIPQYLESGEYIARPSVSTLSNAMDVGDPSNFRRLKNIFSGNGSTWNNMRNSITGLRFDDSYTKAAIKEIDSKFNYLMDPHGAVGYLALRQYQIHNQGVQGIILETAHPAKFLDTMEETLGTKIHIPEQLASFMDKKKSADVLPADFEAFKAWMLNR